MPNPPPIYRSDEKARPQGSPRKESTHVKVRPIDKEKLREHREDTERESHVAHRDETHAERQSERPWYDGNVCGLRGECEHDKFEENGVRGEHLERDERDNQAQDECRNAHGDSHDDFGGDIKECREEHEGGGGHSNKSRPNLSSLIPQSLLPLNLSEHFPFGHGLGFEELFLLGLILVLFRENADEQVIMLLIILLFCG